MAKNPVKGKLYAAPVMSSDEFSRLEVPFRDVDQKLLETLREQGVAIVTGVISEAELSALEDLFHQDLQDVLDREALQRAPEDVQRAAAKFIKEGPRSFPLATATSYLTRSAFCMKRCLSHGRFAWKVRGHPRVLQVFKAAHPSSAHLVGSVDATFFTPSGQAAAKRSEFKAHVDQNMHDQRPGSLSTCEVYQGALYVWPASAEGSESTTVVWPGSHLEVWPQMMQDESFIASGEEGQHYCEVGDMANKAASMRLLHGWLKHARRALVPAGAMLLWNSRTLHAGWKGGPRLAQAICMEPAEARPEAARVAKLRLAALGLPSAHWARVAMQHDLSIGHHGVCSQDSAEAKLARSHDEIVLPLRPSLWPAALRKTADLARLGELALVKYKHSGMWHPTAGSSALLDESILDAYKSYL